MAFTFNGVELVNPSPLNPSVSNSEIFRITITCLTDDYADITALQAYAGAYCTETLLKSGKMSVQTTGTKGSLVLEGNTYTNCAISGPLGIKEVPGTGGKWWQYVVSFVQETV